MNKNDIVSFKNSRYRVAEPGSVVTGLHPVESEGVATTTVVWVPTVSVSPVSRQDW